MTVPEAAEDLSTAAVIYALLTPAIENDPRLAARKFLEACERYHDLIYAEGKELCRRTRGRP